MKKRRWVVIPLFFMVFVWVTIALRFRPEEPELPPPPPDLRSWDFRGCSRLVLEGWSGDDAGFVLAPEFVMALPDSVDAWGRPMDTYRGIPLAREGEAPEMELRWFTRADTLWFVWSNAEVRGAVALRRSQGRDRDRLTGLAIADLRGDDPDASLEARAAMWPVNCYSLRPNRILPVDR